MEMEGLAVITIANIYEAFTMALNITLRDSQDVFIPISTCELRLRGNK